MKTEKYFGIEQGIGACVVWLWLRSDFLSVVDVLLGHFSKQNELVSGDGFLLCDYSALQTSKK